MMPPRCKFCGEDFRHNPRSGKLLRFKISEDDQRWNGQMRAARKAGHPRGAHWFCGAHMEDAKKLTGLFIQDALLKMGEPETSTAQKFSPPRLPRGIKTAGPSDAQTLARITADAFWDDPVNRWIFQSEKGMHAAFLALAKHVYIPRGMGHMIEGKAATMWMPPGGSNEPSLLPMMKLCLSAAWHGGPGSIARMLAFDSVHPKEPHLYLFTVSVRPEFKGQGLGKKILSPVIRAADKAGLPIYLENSKPENHGFYAGLGFKLQEIFRPRKDAPPVEAMRRDAQV